LMAEIVLTYPGILQFVADGIPGIGINICSFDVVRESVDVRVPDAPTECALQPTLDHLSQAPELFAARLSLAAEHLQVAALWPLVIDEVMAVHVVPRLELAV